MLLSKRVALPFSRSRVNDHRHFVDTCVQLCYKTVRKPQRDSCLLSLSPLENRARTEINNYNDIKAPRTLIKHKVELNWTRT